MALVSGFSFALNTKTEGNNVAMVPLANFRGLFMASYALVLSAFTFVKQLLDRVELCCCVAEETSRTARCRRTYSCRE